MYGCWEWHHKRTSCYFFTHMFVSNTRLHIMVTYLWSKPFGFDKLWKVKFLPEFRTSPRFHKLFLGLSLIFPENFIKIPLKNILLFLQAGRQAGRLSHKLLGRGNKSVSWLSWFVMVYLNYLFWLQHLQFVTILIIMSFYLNSFYFYLNSFLLLWN